MNVAAARVTPLRLRFARPLRTAQGEFVERESVLLELRDADGRAGYGEAAPWPGFATESVAEAEATLRGLASGCLRGEIDALEWPALLADGLRHAPAARAAVQGALLDLEARQRGVPLSAQLAARCQPGRGAPLVRVAVNSLLVEHSAQDLHASALRACASGCTAVKLKLGAASLPEDLRRLEAVRDAIGPRVRLRADANGAWSLAVAREALAAIAPFGIEYLEQPVAASDLDGLAALRRLGLVRIAADESIVSEEALQRLLAAEAVDVVVLKPAVLGGPGRALELAVLARDAGVEVVFTHALESAIGARHALACAAAWGEPQAVHGLVTAGLFREDVAEPVAGEQGYAVVSSAPGLGVAP